MPSRAHTSKLARKVRPPAPVFSAFLHTTTAHRFTHNRFGCAFFSLSIVVGYQTTGLSDTGAIKFNKLCLASPTFIQTSAQNYKLGDIKFANFETGNTRIQFLNAYGATAKVTAEMIGAEAYAEFAGKSANFICVTEADAASYGLPAGWYLPDDWDDEGKYPMNDVIIKRGQGFLISAQDENLTVTYSGAVDPGEKGEISLPYNFNELNMMGNTTPVDIYIGDIALKNFETGNTRLQFLNEYGATAKVTAEMIGADAYAEFAGKSANFICVTEKDASDYGLPAGWYLPDDWDGDGAFPMNTRVKILSGQAFLISPQDEGLIITIPSALGTQD